jgi:uncharacterized phage protein gp47/JayE
MAISDLVYIDSAGYHYADYPSFLTFTKAIFTGIYGADIYLGSDSQDGQFTAILAQAFFDTAALGASTYNSFSPVTAQGTGLSRVVKINGVTRATATNSTVDLVVVGVVGTVINNGIAVDILSQQWLLPTSVIIPSSGTITVTATAQNPGAVAANPNTITGIFTPTLGWQTVNNPAAATLGQPVQTDAQLRVVQQQSVSLPAMTVLDATVAAVLAVPGVTNAVGYENDTNTTDSNGLPPHSIAIVVAGGDSMAIAQAIQIKKTPGTETYGTTTELVYDSHGMPIEISFFIATNATINVQITITPLANYVSATAVLIQEAIALEVTSPQVGQTQIIGGDIVLNQIYGPAYLPGTPQAGTFSISSIEISKDSNPLGTADIQLDFNEIPICNPSTNVSVIT